MKRNLQRVAYRPREAAEVTGLSLRFLYYAIQQKDMLSIRVGRCLVLSAHPVRLADLGFDCPSSSWI
jgi:excisionase family DNA binding protein